MAEKLEASGAESNTITNLNSHSPSYKIICATYTQNGGRPEARFASTKGRNNLAVILGRYLGVPEELDAALKLKNFVAYN